MDKLIIIGATALAVAFTVPASPAFAKKTSAVQALDTDNDGTVDLTELKKSAETLFVKLEKDNDGTIEPRELQGRLSKKEFKTADPDGDGTLDKNEFLAVVEGLFKRADPDNDGTLDAKEFASKEGKALLRVTR